MKTLPPAVVYYRMSSDQQTESIPAQKAKLSAWAADKYQLVDEYADHGKSGSKDTKRRSQFLRMITDLTTGKYAGRIKHILCLDLSRFGRLDTITGAEHKVKLRQAGIRLDTYIDGMIDWDSATGRIVDSVKSEANHHVSVTIAEKGLQGRIRVTLAGRPNQQTPYGMAKLVTSPTGDQITIARGQTFCTPKTWQSVFVPGDPREVAAVRYAYETYAAEDISFNELARRMTAKGFPLPGSAKQWQGDTIAWILHNRVYRGDLTIGEIPKGSFFRAIAGRETPAHQATKAAPVVAEKTHQGIIELKLWDRVNGKRQREQRKRKPLRHRGPYALSGILVCGNCGGEMYGQRDPKGQTIYRCHRADYGGTSCKYWIAYEKDFLPFILNRFLPEMRQLAEEQLETSVKEAFAADHQDGANELAKLETKLEHARERFLTAPPALASGLLATLERLEATKVELLRQHKATSKRPPSLILCDWWDAWSAELAATGAVPVEGEPVTVRSDAEGQITVWLALPAAVVRERLNQIDLRLTVWFTRKPKGRGYDPAKVKISAFVCGAEIANTYQAKDLEQLRSADAENSGTADRNCPDLRYERWISGQDLRQSYQQAPALGTAI